MSKATDILVRGVTLYLLPVRTRVPLKFGPEALTEVTCARVCVTVSDRNGRMAAGWGETPLSVQWVWPGQMSYTDRLGCLKEFCRALAEAWAGSDIRGHPIEVGHDFKEQVLPGLWKEAKVKVPNCASMPWLAALVCCSAFDIAVHDAYGKLLRRDVYETYGPEFMNRDLAAFLHSARNEKVSFSGLYPADFVVHPRPILLRAWHLVGGLDLIEEAELTGAEPKDGYPVLLGEWVERDGLKCLKVKLRGNDWEWDYERLVKVGCLAQSREVDWLSADFNCTVTDPAYVNTLLDRLRDEQPRVYGMILYVEQPFPYELRENPIDVHAVSARKPLFLDESAHDWQLIRFGRELGWSGVALKTCKTQTEAILSACWSKAHGMSLMVQDLTNPMLAQVPHVLLAAGVGTIMGVETNCMQFYPEASSLEEVVHPGLYRRRNGIVDLGTLRGPGFGYRVEDIHRPLPPAEACFGALDVET
jgi:L-alanine-DL-glutamate epimerase-like enolase superfamily enzyme